ncbi:hypothetical protein LTR24_004141 [Lithohypha guttulata]|uniref:INSIG domain-containing protein n=1 Tax=Lithohypha guttulata TaxID=1690604 RepID=A0ABR0KD86_9EURO|nr:hypothetical protein LTR24_004141 [Lithohypha guttulata]
MEMPTIHGPTPRRAFEITPASTDSSMPPSPAAESQNPELLMSNRNRSEQSLPPSRTRSILNLTSSTLLGIYSGAADGGRGEELNTPWGTGSQTPAERPSADSDGQKIRDALQVPSFPSAGGSSKRPMLHRIRNRGFRRYYAPLITQTVILFGFGMGFGSLVTHLHKTSRITPVPVPTSVAYSQYYQIAWGLMGVLLGNVLPQIDMFFDDEEAVAGGVDFRTQQHQHIRSLSSMSQSERPSLADNGLGPIWYSTVRSVGAFMGIAFALVSLTLAVANPVLWYLIDRSKPGFALSLFVSVGGTFLTLFINPQFVPVPEIYHEQASDKIGVFLWLASILFCTSLCFGAIGRRLQL